MNNNKIPNNYMRPKFPNVSQTSQASKQQLRKSIAKEL